MTPENSSVEYNKREDGFYQDKDNFSNGVNGERIPLTAEEEKGLKKIYLKLDCFLLTLVTVMYWLNFLDRANIGNARAAGMQRQLGLTNYEYSICLTITYITFLLAEFPLVMIAKKYGFNRVLPLLCVAWGLVTTFQGFVTGYAGLAVCRAVLGACEGAILPGCVTYLSEFYRRRDLGLRTAFFFSAIALAGGFSGLLAAAIINLDGVGGKAGWRWIFYIEGAFTVVCGAVLFFLLPRSINTCKYLSHEQRALLTKAMHSDGQSSGDEEEFSWRGVKQALQAPQAWFMSLIFFPAGATLFAIAYFAPTVVQGLGYTGTTTQLMSVPPYASAFVFSILTSIASDKTKKRGPFLIFWTCIALIGYIVWLCTSKSSTLYGALVMQVTGIYVIAGLFGAWNSNNLAPSYKRASGIVMGFVFTNLGGIMSTWLFPTTQGPRYVKGTSILTAMAALMVFLIICNMVYLTYMNKKKANLKSRGEDNEVLGEGDLRLDFKYMI